MAANAVFDHVDDNGAAGIRGSVFEGTVDSQRVVEDALSRFELDGYRIAEAFPLFVSEHTTNGLHVAGKSGDGEQVPAVAAGNITDATIINGAVIKSDPAGEVRHGLSASPIRVVLVPRDNTSVKRWFAKELIVPEADWSIEELGGGNCQSGMPEQVMEANSDSPCSKCMKQDAAGVAGFVGVVFVPEFGAGVARLCEDGKFCAEVIDLNGGKNLRTGDVAVFVKGIDLFCGELPGGRIGRLWREEAAEGLVGEREVARGGSVHGCWERCDGVVRLVEEQRGVVKCDRVIDHGLHGTHGFQG